MSTGSTTDSGTARFFRRVVGTLGVRFLISGSSVLSGIIIARWLGSSGVGIFSALNVVTLLAITVGSFGLQSAITFLVARDRERAKAVFFNATVFALVVGSFLAAAIALIAMTAPQLFGNIPPGLVTIAAIGLPFQMVSYFCMAVNLGLEKIRVYNAIDISMQVLMLANVSVVVLALGFGLGMLVIWSTATSVLTGLVVWYVTARATRSTDAVRSDLDRPVLREMLDYGSRFFVALAAGMVILRGDLLIVNYYRTAGEAGVYAVATQASLFLHMIPNVIATILFPRTSAKQDESGLMTCRVTRHAFFLMLLVCAIAAPFGFLLPVLYGAAFAGVPIQFLILLPGVFLLGIETIQVQHFSGLGLPRQIPIYWLVAMVMNIGFDLVLVPIFGAVAAAAVSTFSYAVMFVLVALLFRSRTGRTFLEMFLIRRDELRGLFTIHRAAPEPVVEGG